MSPSDLEDTFGAIDIYLFDQLLKGRLVPGMRVLDAGCGSGRNLPYFLRHGFDVCAVDEDPRAIAEVRRLAAALAPTLPHEGLRVEPIEALTFPDDDFDAVIASASLHFARDERHFRTMVAELWRVLRPGGLFFARLASSIGLETRVTPLGDGRFRLPDGSDRFLATEPLLAELADGLGAQELDPLKTTNVANLRCMTTWCLRKPRRKG